MDYSESPAKEGANKRGNSRLTPVIYFFMFEPIFPVNALNQPI
jgi:hypothetical protein